MKVLSAEVNLLGKFTFTNNTEFPVVVSLWQTGPLYYKVIEPEQTWSTSCGAVWFTVKVWLYNGRNNINPTLKYSLLAGTVVGFATLGVFGLATTAIATNVGSSMRNPDWEAWLQHNHIDLNHHETLKGMASIKQCEYSAAGYYAGKHSHLYISGGPVQSASGIDWHVLKVDKLAVENSALPVIEAKYVETAEPVRDDVSVGGSEDSYEEEGDSLMSGGRW